MFELFVPFNPEVGMAVRWIDPKSCKSPERAEWVRRQLIGKHGNGEFVVQTVTGDGKKSPWTVTLTSLGQKLCHEYTGYGDPPTGFKARPVQFPWVYLQPRR